MCASLVVGLAACGVDSTGEALDAAGSGDDAGANTPTQNGADAALDSGSNGVDGGDSSAPCGVNQHVTAHACVACAPGTTRAAGDAPSGADTSCSATVCAADQRVVSHACVACAAGSKNAAGDDASGADTSCDATLCATDEQVVSHACVACPAGSKNMAGDDATGADTTCDATVCAADQRVVAHACVDCGAGSTRKAGDDASDVDTSCVPTLCAANQHVEAHACVVCPPGSENAAGDDASGGDTTCDVVSCLADQHVEANTCVACPSGLKNVAGDSVKGPDTTCDAVVPCAVNEHVSGNACVACAAGGINQAGDLPTGADTSCFSTCPANTHVSNHACLACPVGTSNPAGDSPLGADTACQASGSAYAYDALVLASSPSVYWKLDETAGPAIDVVAGLAANVGAAPVVFGRLPLTTAGQSASFGGYLESASSAVQNPMFLFSVEFWMQPAGPSGSFRGAIASRNGNFRGYNFYIDPDDHLSLWLGNNDVAWSVVSSPATITNGAIYHVVGTYDVNAQTISLYLNGELVASQTGVMSLPNLTRPLRIGAGTTESNTANYPFYGAIDNVAIYPSVLPAATIRAHYLAGTTL